MIRIISGKSVKKFAFNSDNLYSPPKIYKRLIFKQKIIKLNLLILINESVVIILTSFNLSFSIIFFLIRKCILSHTILKLQRISERLIFCPSYI